MRMGTQRVSEGTSGHEQWSTTGRCRVPLPLWVDRQTVRSSSRVLVCHHRREIRFHVSQSSENEVRGLVGPLVSKGAESVCLPAPATSRDLTTPTRKVRAGRGFLYVV